MLLFFLTVQTLYRESAYFDPLLFWCERRGSTINCTVLPFPCEWALHLWFSFLCAEKEKENILLWKNISKLMLLGRLFFHTLQNVLLFEESTDIDPRSEVVLVWRTTEQFYACRERSLLYRGSIVRAFVVEQWKLRLKSASLHFIGISCSHSGATVTRANLCSSFRFLLDSGASIDVRSFVTGRTPLFPAVEHNSIRVVKLLLDEGVHVNAREVRKGHTALTVAHRFGRRDVGRLLAQYGAVRGAGRHQPACCCVMWYRNKCVLSICGRVHACKARLELNANDVWMVQWMTFPHSSLCTLTDLQRRKKRSPEGAKKVSSASRTGLGRALAGHQGSRHSI